jgi:glycosyltransferase involved in cell wall biosynthesis
MPSSETGATASTVPRTAFVSTYVPRQCGIATFTRDLLTGLRTPEQTDGTLQVVALERSGEDLAYPPEVLRRLRVDHRPAYRAMARVLGADGVEVLSLQHEYGIFGGPSGRHILDLLEAAPIPVVATLHTILARPTPTQEAILRAILAHSAQVVTMSERGRQILIERYAAETARVTVIPHGVPDFVSAGVDAPAAKARLGMGGSTLILSCGLLGPAKNIELVLDAFARIARDVPDAIYAVVGATHPEVRRLQGERYRVELQERAAGLGLADRVRFVDRYLADTELATWLVAADVFVTPYRNAQQITSGTLAYALAAGAAVISTPYEHAIELLGSDRGILIPFDDVDALARALARLLRDADEREALRRRGLAYGRTMTWSNVAGQYAQLFRAVAAARKRARDVHAARAITPATEPVIPVTSRLPVCREHLERLRDRLGIIQFAPGGVPDPLHGYCTDDVARALMVDVRHSLVVPSAATRVAIRADLRFLWGAYDPGTGRFRNLRRADGGWDRGLDSEDAHGRAVQALGDTVARCRDRWAVLDARGLLAVALPATLEFAWARPRAYAILGCAAALADPASESRARATLARLVRRLAGAVSRARDADPTWPWPEPRCTYDNGVVAEALIVGGTALGQPDVVRLGLEVLAWLATAETALTGCLRPIGNRGWWPRGGSAARFDQQPIEAASLVSAAAAAWDATGDERWTTFAERAFGWFLGANDLGLPLADLRTGACRDGLGQDGVNAGSGAESTLVWLLAVERMRELRQARTTSRHRGGLGQERMYASTSERRAVARATAASAAP